MQKGIDRFHLPAGVLQGSILSPLLYSTFIDDLPDKIDGRPMQALLYVDDLVLFSHTASHMQRLLQGCS